MTHFEDDEDDPFEHEYLSEKELDEKAAEAWRRFDEFYDSLTFQEKVSHHRQLALGNCMKWCDFAKRNPTMKRFAQDRIKDLQPRLLEIRHYAQTGVWPGKA